MKYLTLGVVAACALIAASPAAASIDVEVPTDNYITYGGADWAWISPCSATAPSCDESDLFEFQSSLGWRLPTVEEFALRPQVSDFGTSDSFACATAYFSDTWAHCDYSDALSGFIWDPGAISNFAYVETWAIRGAVAAAIPEPGTWAMMLLGFGFVGGAMRSAKRRQRLTVSYA